MARSELTPKEIGELLDDAESAYPESDFVSSVRDWFDEHGWITEAQEAALNKVAESTPPWEQEDE